MSNRNIVMATPFKTDHYRECARALEEASRLSETMLWKRKGYPHVAPERARLLPMLGKIAFLSAKLLPSDLAQTIRFSLHPRYDRWAASHLRPGDHVYSSFGYANLCFKKARQTGGKTFLDGGNSHPANFWKILTEEHKRWGISSKPLPEFHYRRSIEMMEHVDYVLAPSGFVATSFLDNGFKEEQVLRTFYPVDLSLFHPEPRERPKDKPLTIINTGGLSLRKGTPYMLEAFRLIRKEVPNARFLLTKTMSGTVRDVIAKYSDLPIEWCGYLGQKPLAERLRSADIFIIPSLEEGLVRTALQAMACGLPTILTPNTGANDYIEDDINGTVVPIRSPEAIAEATLKWWAKIRTGYKTPISDFHEKLSPEAYRARIVEVFAQYAP